MTVDLVFEETESGNFGVIAVSEAGDAFMDSLFTLSAMLLSPQRAVETFDRAAEAGLVVVGG